jgi:hypothetical protein
MEKPVDIETLRITGGTGAQRPARRPPPRPRQHERFLKGPIPWPWLALAMSLPGKAMHMGIRLWHEAGLARSSKVSISLTSMTKVGISRYAASRGLAALEKAGLISVVRGAGRKSEATILATPSATPVSVGGEREGCLPLDDDAQTGK